MTQILKQILTILLIKMECIVEIVLINTVMLIIVIVHRIKVQMKQDLNIPKTMIYYRVLILAVRKVVEVFMDLCNRQTFSIRVIGMNPKISTMLI